MQRIEDWRRERLIRRYSRAMLEAWNAGHKREAMRIDYLRMNAINNRSMSQVRRMESRMDFQPRRAIKRRLMDAFLSGRLPSSIVTTIFRLLRLRSL